ncbi:MAG: hypothetical protein MN733_15535 [Nitrososphaera sp.]|nr:hypothetical protein [Nitrososphaera sp.]
MRLPEGKLIPDANALVSEHSIFGDPEWLFRTERENDHEFCRIYFNHKLPDGSLLTDPANEGLCVNLKYFIFARLHCPVEGYEPALAATAKHNIHTLFGLISWMNTNGFKRFSQLEPDDIDSYVNYLRTPDSQGNIRSNTFVQKTQRAIRVLWQFGQRMQDRLSFEPFDGVRIPTHTKGINRTRIIPEELMSLLVRKALLYLEQGSKNILFLHDAVESIRTEFLKQYGKQYSRKQFLKQANSIMQSFQSRASAANGDEFKCPRTVAKLHNEMFFLQSACYIVLALLSGMRDSELKSLKAGCCTPLPINEGEIEKFKLKGLRYKGSDTSVIQHDKKVKRAVPEEWITLQPAAEAVAILEQLGKRIRPENLYLFKSLKTRRTGRGATVKRAAVTAVGTQYALCYFLRHILPVGHRFRDYKIAPKQFRRTLAFFIGRRPFGELAVAIQYKHVEIATSIGYIGRDRQMLHLIKDERLQASIDVLEKLQDEVNETGSIAGDRGEELAGQLKMLGRAGDNRPREYHLRHLARNLHLGSYNDCWWHAEDAECIKDIPGNHEAPKMSLCRGRLCSNFKVFERHGPIYIGLAREIWGEFKVSRLPEWQRLALMQDWEEARKILEDIYGIDKTYIVLEEICGKNKVPPRSEKKKKR